MSSKGGGGKGGTGDKGGGRGKGGKDPKGGKGGKGGKKGGKLVRAVEDEWQQGWNAGDWGGAQETIWEKDWHEEENTRGTETGGAQEMPVESFGHETAEEA